MKSKYGKLKSNKRIKKRAAPSDPLALEHSKRHGKAVKKGMRKSKKFKHDALRAASRARGKSKAQVAAELLEGTKTAPSGEAAGSPVLGYAPDAPSALFAQGES